MENANAVEEAENTNDPPRNDAVPPLAPTAVAPSEIASPSQVETELPSKPQDTTVGCSVLSQQAKVKILEKACDRYLEEVKEAQNRFLAEIETVMETF
ncbi:hypothetical protein ADEAN_000951200 [Angomonas deanei]|uniref:Uncharacterized protein n=1 Tax=Angomonas deanei TaxID=59799 RepID=A0A7G2CU35_9TRYP|nr:hypothetical protein ADEAN_000951200 [Angomonas deanei]